MIARSALLTFRMNRFETTIVVGAAILSVFVSAAIIGTLNATGWTRCVTDEQLSFTAFCSTGIGGWLFRIARLSTTIVPVFPIVAGLMVGGPVVARELESGTARLAWSLGPSRVRWFLQRVVPTLAMVLVAGLAVGLTANALIHLIQPSIDLDQSFAGFRMRGPLVGVEGLLVASIALAFGAILGRAVPTFILTLVLVAGIGTVVQKVEGQLLTNEALVTQNFQYDGGDLYVDSRIQLKDGRAVSYQEFFELYPELNDIGYNPDEYPNVVLYIPGSRYHEVELREGLVLIALAGVFILIAGVTVVRRRPR